MYFMNRLALRHWPFTVLISTAIPSEQPCLSSVKLKWVFGIFCVYLGHFPHWGGEMIACRWWEKWIWTLQSFQTRCALLTEEQALTGNFLRSIASLHISLLIEATLKVMLRKTMSENSRWYFGSQCSGKIIANWVKFDFCINDLKNKGLCKGYQN